ncbi:MAG: squalene--hopene cyclase [Gemmataceae bacterium]|nr:squalene--hopene cyclase [Gemmataceae bacterium]MDW8267422.1 squalene--hopene cyclase [Gemmataceae bacterium]
MTTSASVPGLARDLSSHEPRHGQPWLAHLRQAVQQARQHLLGLQKEDGHWVGELEGDTILESEYILLMAFLGRERDPRVAKAARYILRQQLPEGGWNNYPGGPAELSVSVKAYFALKLAGHSADQPYMRRACEVIRSLGGASRCNSFTKFYLALLGQFPYANCPAVPPEMILLPRWFYFNIYAMSSWSRTILVPLSIVYAHKPVRRLPPESGIAELFLEPPTTPLWPHPPTRRWLTWTNFFLVLDQLLKQIDRLGPGPIRRLALRRAEAWMRERFADSDGLGAIFPPMIYTVIVLRCLGYSERSPEWRWALQQLEALGIEDGETLRLQPCLSPVWDTALSTIGLVDSLHAVRPSPDDKQVIRAALDRSARWLLGREVHRRGDWSLANPHLEPGGWFFEYRNAFYPDTDDTAMVLMALAKAGHAVTPDGRPAAERGLRWLLGMQNSDGGWAAFDRDINRQLLTKVPFADHNAMLDPSCPDITGRALEALGHYGYRLSNPQVQRAIAFLRRTQTSAGGWSGRWGVNYLYGTWQVLAGLRAIGFDMADPLVRRAVGWLCKVQQPSGAWGESCRSYDDPRWAGQGEPTASQTAWALLGLLAAGEAGSDAVRAGINWLLDHQRPDGSWHEGPFTGTGFPRVFYLKYHMYPVYFPLMALARYLLEVGRRSPAGTAANPPPGCAWSASSS